MRSTILKDSKDPTIGIYVNIKKKKPHHYSVHHISYFPIELYTFQNLLTFPHDTSYDLQQLKITTGQAEKLYIRPKNEYETYDQSQIYGFRFKFVSIGVMSYCFNNM